MLYYAENENYDKASAAQAQLVELLKNSTEKEIYTSQLSTLAILYQQNEDYEKAIETYRLTIKNIKKIWGTKLEFLAQNYAGLSVVLIANEQFEEGKIAYKNADTIFRNVEIESLVDYLDILYAIRSNLQFANQYNENELHIAQREAEIAKKAHGIFSIHYARVLADIGNSFIITGEHSLGYPYLKKAYDFYEVRQLELPKEFIEIISDVAQYHFLTGNYDSAIQLTKKQKQLSLDIWGENSLQGAKIYNQLGKLYFEAGEYAISEEYMLKNIKTLEAINATNSASYSIALLNLARLYDKLGNIKKSLNYALKAEQVLNNTNTEYKDFNLAKTQEALGILYGKIGEYDAAKLKLLYAITLYKRLLGKNNFALATTYVNLGQVYLEQENTDSVIWCLNKSIPIIEKTYTPTQFGYEYVLTHKKHIYYLRNQYYSVAVMAKQSLKLVESTVGKKHPSYRKSLYELAVAYATINHPQTSNLIQQVIAEDRQQLKEKLTFLSGDELLQFISEQLYEANRLLAFQTAKDNTLTSDLFNHTLLLKGASLKYSNTILQAAKTSTDSTLLATYSTLSNLKKLLAKEYAKPNSKLNIIDLEVKADELEKQLVKKTSAYRNLDTLFATDWKNIQKQLKKDEVAIEFVKYDEWRVTQKDITKYGALLLRKKDKQPLYIPLCNEEQLKIILGKVSPKQMFSTRSNELLGEVESLPTNYGDTLYQLIWKPLEKYLQNKKTIYLSADGLLHQVAFNALPVNDSTLLIDKYRLVQLLSLKEIKKQNDSTALKSITLFGGLEYNADNNNIAIKDSTYSFLPEDRGATSSFNYLQGTLNETQSIQQLLKNTNAQVKFYSGKEGTEEQFKSISSAAPQILHLATHGFFIKEPKSRKHKKQFGLSENAFSVASNPLMRGGLVLSGGNRAWQGLPTQKGKEDGILTAYEVAGLDLSATQLVVLSACQTGLGEVQETEGVFGLQRAFKMAGVNQLIMSLWSVPDKETKELMELFYSELIKTNNTRKAFENAQKTMHAKYAPYYWAAFVLVE